MMVAAARSPGLEAGPSEVIRLEVTVSPDEVRRYLGYPRRRSPSVQVAGRIQELWPLACSLLAPRGALRIVSASELLEAAMPRPTPRVAVGLCTIGPELEHESDRRNQEGDPLDGLVLDAFGSAAAEAAAEALARCACARAGELGLGADRRISPGYGRWPVTAQPSLLALLPAAALGVELSEGLMMRPRKSVSFAARLREGTATARSAPACRSCALQPCPYRRSDHRGGRRSS